MSVPTKENALPLTAVDIGSKHTQEYDQTRVWALSWQQVQRQALPYIGKPTWEAEVVLCGSAAAKMLTAEILKKKKGIMILYFDWFCCWFRFCLFVCLFWLCFSLLLWLLLLLLLLLLFKLLGFLKMVHFNSFKYL